VALVPPDAVGRATIVARQSGVIAGLPAAAVAVAEMNATQSLVCHVSDGQAVEPGTPVATLSGSVLAILTAERTVLNLLGRMSGIASLAARYVAAVSGTKARIYDTRKTTAGWRRLEKYAVRQGGACNHRLGLYDAILIKDNHLAFGAEAGGAASYSPGKAVRQARQFLAETFAGDPRADMIVEVEVDSLEQLRQVLIERPDIVLLDNMPPEMLKAGVKLRDELAAEVQLEASGGVNLATVRSIAETGVDRISVGALTHSAVVLDLGLDWQKAAGDVG